MAVDEFDAEIRDLIADLKNGRRRDVYAFVGGAVLYGVEPTDAVVRALNAISRAGISTPAAADFQAGAQAKLTERDRNVERQRAYRANMTPKEHEEFLAGRRVRERAGDRARRLAAAKKKKTIQGR